MQIIKYTNSYQVNNLQWVAFVRNSLLTIHQTTGLSAILKERKEFSHLDIIRIHRSFAIAIDKFNHIEGNQIFIRKQALPIGKAYKKDLLDNLER